MPKVKWQLETFSATQMRDRHMDIPNGKVVFSSSDSKNIKKIELCLSKEYFYIFIYSHQNNETSIENLKSSVEARVLEKIGSLHNTNIPAQEDSAELTEASFYSNSLNDNKGDTCQNIFTLIRELEPAFPAKYLKYIETLTAPYSFSLQTANRNKTTALVALSFISEHRRCVKDSSTEADDDNDDQIVDDPPLMGMS